jgi:hypothetical protein
MTPPVLAIDAATTSGYALGSVADGLLEHGSYTPKLPVGAGIGEFLGVFGVWLADKIARHNVARVVFESPVLGRTTSLQTARKLYSMAAFVELVAWKAQVPCTEANLTDIRKHWIGVARGPKRETEGGPLLSSFARRRWLKDRIEAECRRRGFKPVDDNDADSIALLSFALTRNNPDFVLAAQPMARAA